MHSAESFDSILSSRSRQNLLVAQVQAQPPWWFDLVSIDDLELLDTSLELYMENANVPPPPGLRMVPRKLLLRLDFEFIQRSGKSVSSMGIRVIRSLRRTRRCHSVAGPGERHPKWQVNAIIDSLSEDGEDGGVDEALKCLEGRINLQRRKDNALKVDGWVRTIRECMAAATSLMGTRKTKTTCMILIGTRRGLYGEARSSAGRDSMPATPSQITVSVASESEDFFSPAAASGSSFGFPLTPVDAVTLRGLGLSMTTVDAKRAPEDAIPLEILQSWVLNQGQKLPFDPFLRQ